MAKKKKKDIIENILSGKEDKHIPEMEELDCLIYQNASDLTDEEAFVNGTGKSWKKSNGNVSIQVWESKAKIRVRVSPETKRHISLSRIATIAMNAILEELKKEGK